MKLLMDLGIKQKGNYRYRFGLYECPECNKEFELRTSSVTSGNTTKCFNCSRRISKTKHSMSKTNIYYVWAGEIARCRNKNHPAYKNYGGRGIKVSDEFHNFDVWFEYIKSLSSYKKKGYTVDRIDNDGNYERGNLRWAKKSTQSRNTRKIISTNTSGYRGVSKANIRGRFVARICLDKKNKVLGTFTYPYTAAYIYDSYIIMNDLEHTRNFA